MPTSHWQQINEIVDLIMGIRPKSILDIGVGFGKYGVLAREYLELWDGRGTYDNWKVRIDGIEVFSQYKNPIYDFIYDNIYYGDALKVVPLMGTKYDLILMIDVIEHFNKDEGLQLIDDCIKISRHIIVSTPLIVTDQGAAFNNQHETHKATFTVSDFSNCKTVVPNSRSLICVLSCQG